MRDIPVSEVLLDRSCVVPLVGKLVAGGVPEYAGMNREGAGELASTRDQLARRGRRYRPAVMRPHR